MPNFVPQPPIGFNSEDFDPNDSVKVGQLMDHFYSEWTRKTHNMIARRMSDIRMKELLVTPDICHNAFVRFIKNCQKHPERKFNNFNHLEATFVRNIGFAISKAIRDSNKVIPALHDKSRELFITENEILAKAVSNLSTVEYRIGSGLSPRVLYELIYFWRDKIKDIATKYDFSNKTISTYKKNIISEISDYLLAHGVSPHGDISAWLEDPESEFGTRPVVQSIVDKNQTPFVPNDIIFDINGIVYYNGISVKLNLLQRLSDKSSVSNRDCVIRVLRYANTPEEKSVELSINYNCIQKVLENTIFDTVEYAFR